MPDHFQPRVDDLDPFAQHGRHQHLGEALAEGVRRTLLVAEVDDLPTEPRELVQQGLPGVVALFEPMRLRRHDGHCGGVREVRSG